MRTITFFSYKGGTGRSLAVANASYYLTQLGFKVVAMDFDLEAPGLRYKFSKADDSSPIEIKQGLVDYLYDVAFNNSKPGLLTNYTYEIPIAGKNIQTVTLFPAGRAPSADYWKKLCRPNWP